MSYLEENARRRYHQLRLEQQQKQQHKLAHQSLYEANPAQEFEYRLPTSLGSDSQDPPFAYGPARPEFYASADSVGSPSLDSIYYKIMNGVNDSPVRLSSDGIPSYKLKAPMDVNPSDFESQDVLLREDLHKFSNKLPEHGLSSAYQHEVERKHMEMETALGMYVIALIAGVSAAVTVGLLAIGIGWYT